MCGDFHSPLIFGKCFFKDCDYLKSCCEHCLVKFKGRMICAQHLEIDMYDRAILVLEELESRKKMYEEIMGFVNIRIKEENDKKFCVTLATLNNQCIKCEGEIQDLYQDEYRINDGLCYLCRVGLPRRIPKHNNTPETSPTSETGQTADV